MEAVQTASVLDQRPLPQHRHRQEERIESSVVETFADVTAGLRGYRSYLQADAYAAYDAMCKNPMRYLTEVAMLSPFETIFF